MNYTLSDLITILKRRLKDEDFDENLLTDYINSAQNEILGGNKYKFLERVDGPFEIAKTGELSLPFDYQTTVQIFAKDSSGFSRPLEYLPAEDFFKTPSKKWSYCVYGRNLYYRLPDPNESEKNNMEYELYRCFHLYYAKPMPMIRPEDRPIIPAEFIEAIICSVMARAEQSRDNFDFAQIYENKADDLVVNMNLRYGPRQQSVENRARLAFKQSSYIGE